MKSLGCVLIIVAIAIGGFSGSGVTPVVIPPATANGVTVGPGFLESYQRQIVRTGSNVVYVVAADDNPCQAGTSNRGVIHVWKSTSYQSTNALVPAGFTEQATSDANRPQAASVGSCLTQIGNVNMLLSPDIRLDRSGIVHVAYIQATSQTSGTVYYQAYSTATDSWTPRVQIGTGAYADSGTGWPRTGQLALTLDANDKPWVFWSSTTSVQYANIASGAWVTGAAAKSESFAVMHPNATTALDGSIHIVWVVNALSTPSTRYAKYAGTWGAAETVASGVLSNSNDDQSPSVAVDRSNIPHVLYLVGNPSQSNDYVRLKYRSISGSWVDNTPPGTAGPSNASGTWFAHTPQNYIDANNNEFVFLGHDVAISPGVFSYQTGGPGANWTPAVVLDPRDANTTAAGSPGIDGSASIRFDPLRDNNPNIVDVLYYDESDGSGGIDHHATVYYKALVIDNATAPAAPTGLTATVN